MILLHMLSDINVVIEYLLFFCIFFHQEFKKPDKHGILVLSISLSIWVLSCMCGIWLQEETVGPFPVLLILVYVVEWSLFDITVWKMIAAGLGQWLFISMIENALYIVLSQFKWSQIFTDNLIVLILSTTFLISYLFFVKSKKLPTVKLNIKIWMLTDGIMFVLTTMMMFFSYVITRYHLNEKEMFAGKMLMASGQILIVILLYGIIYISNSINILRGQKEIAEIQNKLQKEHFEELLERETETKKFRHDIINDLLQIQNFSNNKKYDKLELYLEETLGTIYKIHKSYYNVGNDIVNTVLNYYLQPLKEKYQIFIQGYMSDQLTINDRDLCILVSNLLKNATEAIQKTECGCIWFTINEGKEYLYISLKNNFQGEILFDNNGLPLTSKSDKANHGIGTYNIKEIVKRNNGKYQINIKDQIFSSEVYLKL